MAMGLQKSSGADFLPSFRFNAVSGLAVIAGSRKANDGVSYEKFENDVAFPAKFIFDFSNLEVGWVEFAATGPDFSMVKVGERMPAKPSETHKQGFRIHLYNKDHGLVTFSNSSKTVAEPMDALHDQFLRDEKANAGKVPVVEIIGTKKVQVKSKEGVKTYRQPEWKIVSWVARPEGMTEKAEVVAPEPVASSDDF